MVAAGQTVFTLATDGEREVLLSSGAVAFGIIALLPVELILQVG